MWITNIRTKYIRIINIRIPKFSDIQIKDIGNSD